MQLGFQVIENIHAHTIFTLAYSKLQKGKYYEQTEIDGIEGLCGGLIIAINLKF